MAKQKNIQIKWFIIGLISVLLSAPNGTVIKWSTGQIDPYFYNAARFFIVGLFSMPYVWRVRHKFTPKGLKYTFYVGIFLSFAVIGFVTALKNSPVSYVEILALLTPIVFILYSKKLIKEKINQKAFAGVTLAALGAFVIVVLPITFSQGTTIAFYPLATIFMLLNVLTFPLATIFARKANQNGIPLLAVMGLSAWVIAIVNVTVYLMINSPTVPSISFGGWLAIAYSGFVVAYISRSMHVASYERVGAAVSSSLMYLEALVAIVLPIVVLEEKLAITTVIGGCMILLGVFVAEYNAGKRHRYHVMLRHHH